MAEQALDTTAGNGPGPGPSLRQAFEGGKPLAVANRISPVKNSDYEPELGKGQVYLGSDINTERAQKMGTLEQAGKFVGNTLANVLTGIGESAGHLYNLGTQWGDDRNYDNALLTQMDDWKNPFGEIYRENPDQTFDLADPAWWTNNASGLISSIGQFAVMGIGVGSLVAKGAGAAVKAGLLTSEAAGTAGQTATAALMSYTEGAMSAKNVFSRVYTKQLQDGLSEGLTQQEAEERATHRAAQGASTTAQLNTVYGTLLNLGSVAPMFKDFKNSSEFFRTGAGRRLASESLEDYGVRLQTLSASSPELAHYIGGHGVGHLAAEAGKEGFEEVMNQYVETTGEDTGNKGKSGNLLGQFGEVMDLQKTWEKTANQEGLLNFMLGAIGGAGQTVLMGHVPTLNNKISDDGSLVPKRDDAGEVMTDKKGDPIYEKAWYNSRFLDTNKRFQYFDTRRDAILEDVKQVTAINNKIDEAVKAGDQVTAQSLADKLLSVHHLNAIVNGTADNWIQEYESYKNFDNKTDLGAEHKAQADEASKGMTDLLNQFGTRDKFTPEAEQEFSGLEQQYNESDANFKQLSGQTEATQRGFATSMQDNAYQEKATQSIADLKQASKLYEETVQQFSGYAEEDMSHNLVATVVAKKLDNVFNQRNIDQYAPVVEKAGLAISADKTAFIKLHNDYQRAQEAVEVHNALNDAINNNKPQDARAELVEEGVDFEDNDEGILKAARLFQKKLNIEHLANVDNLQQQEDLVKNSAEYLDYKAKNPNKSWSDYVDHILKNSIEATEYNQMLAQLNALKRATINNLGEIEQIRANPGKYVRSIIADAKGAIARQVELEKYRESSVNRREYESKVFRDNEINRLLKENAKAQDQVDELQDKLLAVNEKIMKLEKSRPQKPNTILKKHNDLQDAHAERNKLLAEQKVLLDSIAVNSGKIRHLSTFEATPAQPQAPVQAPVKPVVPVTPVAPVAPTTSNTNIIADSIATFNDLIEMHGLDDAKARAELSAYLSDPSKFPAKMAQTFVFAPQAVQAQLYSVVDTLLGEVRKNSQTAAEIEEVPEMITEDEEVDENEVSFGMVKKKNTPIEVKIEKAEKALEKDITAPVQIVQGVQATRNTDGSNTIHIAQGQGEDPITIVQKPRGRGYAYTVDEGIFQGEKITGKDAKDVAEQYLADEGTSLSAISARMDDHVGKAQVKYQRVVTKLAPVEEQPTEAVDQYDLPVSDFNLVAPSLVMNPNIDLGLRQMDGAKRLSALTPIANHLAYIDVVGKDGTVSRQNATNSLNKDANLKVLVPGYLNTNDQVEYHVDTDAIRTLSGVTLTDENRNPLVSPQNPNELMNDIGAVPIKITNTKGETIGHIMTIAKLNEKVGDGYANVEVLENFDEHEQDEAKALGVRSIDDLNRELLTLRDAVLNLHKEGNVAKSTVKAVGDGVLIYNTTAKEGGGTRLDAQQASMLLPDPNLELGLTFGENVYTEFGKQKEIVNEIRISDVGVGALVPTAAGNFEYVPLRTNKLVDYQVETMFQVLQLYANKDLPGSKAQFNQIQNLTGFDVSKGVGLRAFMSQYYLTPKNFTEAQLVESPVTPTLQLSISDGLLVNQVEKAPAEIKIGVVGMMQGMKIEGTNVTNKSISLMNPDGTINPEFEQVFRARMGQKVLQATYPYDLNQKHPEGSIEQKQFGTLKNYKGVNSKGPVTEIRYADGGFETRKEHQDYNHYLKSNATTFVNGTNKVGNDYVYTVHPQIQIDPKITTGDRVNQDEDDSHRPTDIDIAEDPLRHPMYTQMQNFKAEFPDSLKSIESAIIEAEAQGFTEEFPEWMGNPFEDC